MNSDEYSGDQGCWTNMTNFIDEYLQKFFYRLGLFCAKYPYYVLPLGFIAVVALGLGTVF
jgi:hypothetical protein